MSYSPHISAEEARRVAGDPLLCDLLPDGGPYWMWYDAAHRAPGVSVARVGNFVHALLRAEGMWSSSSARLALLSLDSKIQRAVTSLRRDLPRDMNGLIDNVLAGVGDHDGHRLRARGVSGSDPVVPGLRLRRRRQRGQVDERAEGWLDRLRDLRQAVQSRRKLAEDMLGWDAPMHAYRGYKAARKASGGR